MRIFIWGLEFNTLIMNPSLSLSSPIETERLFLRPYQAEDAAWYFEMSQRNKPHLARYESGNMVMMIHRREVAEIVIRDFVSNWSTRGAFYMGVFLKDTQEFVAQIYIGVVTWDLPEFEIGYFVDLEQEGRGYVTEATKGALRLAFEHLGAHRVRLECDDTNTRSYRVAERCGMVQEGHIRQNKINADKTVSGTFIYGLLRSEYLSSPAADST